MLRSSNDNSAGPTRLCVELGVLFALTVAISGFGFVSAATANPNANTAGASLAQISPTSAKKANAKIQHRLGRSRLVVHIYNFAKRGPNRAARVRAQTQPRQFTIGRAGPQRWLSGWFKSRTLRLLPGKKLRLLIELGSGRVIALVASVSGNAIADRPPAPNPSFPVNLEVRVDSLVPSWRPMISDYTVDCSDPVQVEIDGSSPVSVDSAPLGAGSFSSEVNLTPGQAFKIAGPEISEQTIRCRPGDLYLPSVTGRAASDYLALAPTIAFGSLSSNYAMIVDRHGTPIWWMTDPNGGIVDFKLIDPETLAWTRAGNFGFVQSPSNQYDLRGFDGELKGSVELDNVGVGIDHHDLQQTSDGGWLTLGYLARDCPAIPSECEDLSPWGGPAAARVIDAVVQKIDASGAAVWTWNSRDHIGLAESSEWIPRLRGGTPYESGANAFDIIHINAVEPSGEGILISVRHTDAVYRMADPGGSGEIDWKLGGTPTPESLSVVGDPLGTRPLGGQHDIRQLADGTITIHDNGTAAGPGASNRPPRMVHYQVVGSEATLLDQLSDELSSNSFCCGGGRKNSHAGWTVSWGAGPLVAEYDESGERIFSMTFPGGLSSYRVVPIDAEKINISSLRQGMETLYPR